MINERNHRLGYPRVGEDEVRMQFVKRVIDASRWERLTPPGSYCSFKVTHVSDTRR